MSNTAFSKGFWLISEWLTDDDVDLLLLMNADLMDLVIIADIVGLFVVDDGWYDKLVSGTMKNRDGIFLLLNWKLLNIF